MSVSGQVRFRGVNAGRSFLAAGIAAIMSLPPVYANAGTLLEDLELELGRQVDRVSQSLVTVVSYVEGDARTGVTGGPFGVFTRGVVAVGGARHARGCGAVIDSLGHVLSTFTVIQGSSRVELIAPDGELVPATVIGVDPVSDIALLQAAVKKHWVPVPRGDSRRMTPGSWVTVLGNAYGVGPSVATGVVSRRSVVSGLTGERLIQMNVRAGPGDMGGVVMNSRGHVVGLVCAILADPRNVASGVASATSEGRYPVMPTETGISFAIPFSSALVVADRIRKGERCDRGFLGVEMADTAAVPGSSTGVRVGSVVARSPAEAAGLRSGDIILEANGQAVPSSEWLRGRVQQAEPGSRLALRVRRGEDDVALEVTVGRLVTIPPRAAPRESGVDLAGGPRPVSPGSASVAAVPVAASSSAVAGMEQRVRELEQELARLRQELDRTRATASVENQR